MLLLFNEFLLKMYILGLWCLLRGAVFIIWDELVLSVAFLSADLVPLVVIQIFGIIY